MEEQEEIELLTDKEIDTYFPDDTMKDFLYSIKKYKILPAKEQVKLAELAQNGNIEARHKLINHNLRLVISVAKKYLSRIKSMELLDLIQEGTIGLNRAIDTYDSSSSQFSTYAVIWIKQAITRAIKNTDDEIRKPVGVQELASKYHKLINEAKQKGIKLSDEEIANKLEVSIETLKRIKHAISTSNVESMNKKLSDEDESDELEDFISDNKNDYDALLDEINTEELALVLKEILDDRDYYILYKRVLAPSEERLTLEEVSKYFNITRERVRQIESKILKKIRPYFDKNSKVYGKVIKIARDNLKGRKVKVKPLTPQDIARYTYLLNKLTEEQRILYELLYIDKYKYDTSQLCDILVISRKGLFELNNSINEIIKKYTSSKNYKEYKDNFFKNYGSTMYKSLIKEAKIKLYDEIKVKYSDKTYEEIINLFGNEIDKLEPKEKELIYKYFIGNLSTKTRQETIFKNLNLQLFNFNITNSEIPKNKLLEVYLKNKNQFNEEQRLFLECFYFNIKDKKEFYKKYSKPNEKYKSYLIYKLERIYTNLNEYFENNFTKEKYLTVRDKLLDKLSKEDIELLDLYYGINNDRLNIKELSIKYNTTYLQMHGRVRNIRDQVMNIYANRSRTLTIDKDIYIPYLLDKKYKWPEKNRYIILLFLKDNKSYQEICNITGLSTYNISNIITEGLRKIDFYRYNIIKVPSYTKEEIDNIFKEYPKYLDENYKEIIYLRYIENLDNDQIASKLNISKQEVNKIISKFNKFVISFKIKDYYLKTTDYKEEINKHHSQCIFDDLTKQILSYFYNINNEYNTLNKKLTSKKIVNY